MASPNILLPPPETSPLNPEESEDTFEYQVLQNPYERMHYVHLTDDLIRKLDGSDEYDPKPDYVIYLDKSARPVNWMVQALWDTLAEKDEDGNVPERPQSLFVNIDARRKKKDESPEGIANLRALFTVDEPRPGVETMEQETLLDGKNVLIVDEIYVSGDTIKKAHDVLGRAYPSTNFKTYTWMNGRPKTQGSQATNNPRWYHRDTNIYRVVHENVDDDRAQELLQEDERIRRGWSWLAKLPKTPSPSVRLLHDDVKHIAEDIKSGQLPYWPSFKRSDEEERIEKFNGIPAKDFDAFRDWMKGRFWPNAAVAGTITDTTGPMTDERARKEAVLAGNIEFFDRLPMTDTSNEFKNRFAFTQASVANRGLLRIVKNK